MDFITGLPPSQTKKDAIWVVVNRLTKIAHFIPVNVRDSMEKLARIYAQKVIRLHRVPSSIVFDEIRGSRQDFGRSSRSCWERLSSLKHQHIHRQMVSQSE
jgi:hypothetical protein